MKKLLQDIREFASELVQQGWAERNAGNISVRFPGGLVPDWLPAFPYQGSAYPNETSAGFDVLITAAESRMRQVARNPGDFLVYLKNNLAEQAMVAYAPKPGLKPSSERNSHLQIHQVLQHHHPESTVLAHAHLTEFIALSHLRELKNKETLNRLLFAMHPEIKNYLPGGVGYVPFIEPGTRELAEASSLEFKAHELVLWERHGILVCGVSARECLEKMELIAKAARIFFLSASAGARISDFV